MGTTTVEQKIEKVHKILDENGFCFIPIRLATPEEFHEAIGKAKKQNPHGTFVDQHTIAEYANMRFLFVTLDGNAGVAITWDNDIVSIFNGGEQRGVLKTLIPVALECGGNKLDNYDSDKLSSLYELYGFDPISSVHFDRTFASEDWNYERDGTPDIVFWAHKNGNVNDVVLNFGNFDVDWDNVQFFRTYDEARLYRDLILNERSISY